jgi:hypothetical protein
MEGGGVAGDKSTARDLGAFICFEDEAGQGLSPPKGRTWAPRGARPVVKVRGAGGGRVSIAGVACYRPGDRPHLFYQLRACHRRKGEPKGFTWARPYRDLIIATHRNLSAPLAWCWDNLNIHLAPELADFAPGEQGLAAGLPAARLCAMRRPVGPCVAWPRRRGERPAQVRFRACPLRSGRLVTMRSALLAVLTGIGPHTAVAE